MSKNTKARLIYCAISAILLVVIVLIALFVRDRFIRPYGGDILVTVLLCAMARIVFPNKIKLLPLWVMLFAFGVEILQYFDVVSLLGLSHISIIRIAVGSVFSVEDLFCYAAGCLIFFLADRFMISKIK